MEETKKITCWKRLKNLVNKNKKTQGITLTIIGMITGYITTVLIFFAFFKSHGLATGFLLFTSSMLGYTTLELLAKGGMKIEEFYKEKEKGL